MNHAIATLHKMKMNSPAATWVDAACVVSPSIVDEDPPIHTVHRRSLHKPFSRGRMLAMEPLTRRLVTEQLDSLCARGDMDLVSDFLLEVPAYVLFEMFGVPRSELANVRRFVQRLAVLGFGRPDPATQIAMTAGRAEFWDFCRAHVARLMENPGSDAISEFIQGLRDPRSAASPDLDYVATVTFQMLTSLWLLRGQFRTRVAPLDAGVPTPTVSPA